MRGQRPHMHNRMPAKCSPEHPASCISPVTGHLVPRRSRTRSPLPKIIVVNRLTRRRLLSVNAKMPAAIISAGFRAGHSAPVIRQSRRPIDVHPGNFRNSCGAGIAVIGLNGHWAALT